MNETYVQIICKKEIKKNVLRFTPNFSHRMVMRCIHDIETARVVMDFRNIKVETRADRLSVVTRYHISEMKKIQYIPYSLGTSSLINFDPSVKYLNLHEESTWNTTEYKVEKISYNTLMEGYDVYIDKIIKCDENEIEGLDPEIKQLYDSYSGYLNSIEEQVKLENNKAQSWYNKIKTEYQELKWYNFIKKRKLLEQKYVCSIGLGFDIYYASIHKENFKNKKHNAFSFSIM